MARRREPDREERTVKKVRGAARVAATTRIVATTRVAVGATKKEPIVESHENNSLNLTNERKKTVLDAFSHEVHLFLHCHLRGYDRTGCGLEMSGHYYDKYGAPVDRKESWSEGYRAVEKELGKHFDQCANPKNELPLVAGYGGGVHLYKPIQNHDVEPWNITGWIPLESKWVCEEEYFKNRHFFALRGNEIQNDLWDYHPYKEDKCEDCEDSKYNQYVPLGPYRGGYWYPGDIRGRYLHIMSLKNQQLDGNNFYNRYNFIVHPLAFRAGTCELPDNSVDGMQWSITNIVNDPSFKDPEKLSKWGEKCHGLEIFNDFTYYYSWQPGEDKIFNGTLMNYTEPRKVSRYHYWFNTYPLEFGEFLLDSALTMGTYLHPISANDAFYNRATVPPGEEDPEAEGMEKILLADPKGVHIKRLESAKAVEQESCSNAAGKRRSQLATDCPIVRKEVKDSMQFRKEKPYAEDTIFGYQTIIDPKLTLRRTIENHPAPNVVDDDDDLKTGLNTVEPTVIKMMQAGQFYGHTGVFDFFDYSNGFSVPFLIPGQIEMDKLCFDIPRNTKDMIFAFPKVKETATCLVWRYMIQTTNSNDKNERSVLTTYGYFKMSHDKPTELDLSNYPSGSVCWLRFTAFHPDNPQMRAWFPAVRGPAFAQSADTIVDVAKFQPKMEDIIMTTISVDGRSNMLVKEGTEFQPTVINTADLNLIFSACSFEEQDQIFAYFFQAYPLKQPIDKLNPDIRYSKTDPDDSSKPLASRIWESVHGYFQLCDEAPSKFNLASSWDETSVCNQEVNVYGINNKTAQPCNIDHLVLQELPPVCK